LGVENRTELRNAWTNIETSRRQEISGALVELAEEDIEFDFHEVFLAALNDPDENVRTSALEGLWEDSSSTLLEDMVRMLADDPSGSVRAAAAIGLGRFSYLGALDELNQSQAKLVRNSLFAAATDAAQPFEVRRRAIESLGYQGDDPSIEGLIKQSYADPEQLMKESALVAMGRSMQAHWLEAIEHELIGPSPALRYEAARALGEMGDLARGSLSRLLPLVDDEDNEVGLAAIWSLGQIGGSHAKRVLQRIARSNNEARRQAANDALEELSLDDDE
jgi:HEAT repeat protein